MVHSARTSVPIATAIKAVTKKSFVFIDLILARFFRIVNEKMERKKGGNLSVPALALINDYCEPLSGITQASVGGFKVDSRCDLF